MVLEQPELEVVVICRLLGHDVWSEPRNRLMLMEWTKMLGVQTSTMRRRTVTWLPIVLGASIWAEPFATMVKRSLKTAFIGSGGQGKKSLRRHFWTNGDEEHKEMILPGVYLDKC